MRRGNSRLLSSLAFAGMTFLICSCGEKGASIAQTGASLEGTVHYGDEPIHFALIIAQSPSGSATSSVDEEGRYHMSNVPLGEVNIAVNTKAGQGDFMTKTMNAGASKKGKVNWKYLQVPDKFQDPNTTTLKTTINKGSNTYDIKVPK